MNFVVLVTKLAAETLAMVLKQIAWLSRRSVASGREMLGHLYIGTYNYIIRISCPHSYKYWEMRLSNAKFKYKLFIGNIISEELFIIVY